MMKILLIIWVLMTLLQLSPVKIEAEIKNETAKAIISTFMMVLGALWITCTLIISITAGQRLYEWLFK